jgi:hypothetical protein
MLVFTENLMIVMHIKEFPLAYAILDNEDDMILYVKNHRVKKLEVYLDEEKEIRRFQFETLKKEFEND